MTSVPTAPVGAVLPIGFGISLSERTKRCDNGASLMGNGRVLYLAGPAASAVNALPGLVGQSSGVSASLARRLLAHGLADPWWSDPAAPDGTVTDVTVVIPTRDRAASVADLLRALPSGVPVIVVDDGSRDGEAVLDAARRHGARVVRHETNRGPAAARNTGLAAVTTPFVAFCDSDVVPETGWLGALRRHLDDPSVAVVGPRVLGHRERTGASWIERYERSRSSLDLGPTPAAVRVHGEVAYLPSACLIARVDALGDGFDEDLRAGEDVDLIWRLLAAGWAVRYDPAASVHHDHRVGLAAWMRRKAFYGTSAAPLAARHPGAVAPMIFSPWTLTLSAAVLAQRRWSPAVAAATYAVATVGAARRLKRGDRPLAAASVLTLEGVVASAWQTSAAINRHYWPLAAVAATVSGRARRVVVVAALGEGIADWHRLRPGLDPVRHTVAHRLDDLAYGAGLWWGAFRNRSPRALLPVLTGVRRRRRGG